MDKTIRRVTDFEEQRAETLRYWQSRPASERMDAVEEIVRDAYYAKGIDLDARPQDRTLIRFERTDWNAA
jgi:hypothetical protein